MEWIVVVLMISPVIVAILYFNERGKEYTNLPTFEGYKAQHPGSVSRGRVECHYCGGTRLHIRGRSGANDRHKTHFCTTCGMPLYRSTY